MKLDAHVIDNDTDDHLVLLKLLRKYITELLQMYFILQEMSHALLMYRKQQSSRFCSVFCDCFRIDSSIFRRCSPEQYLLDIAKYFLIRYDEDNSWSLRIL